MLCIVADVPARVVATYVSAVLPASAEGPGRNGASLLPQVDHFLFTFHKHLKTSV